ncbi:MAG: excinuclease ABC subunit UvrA [candidate division KSB1 bacterium]|nr:excinuclease ABC subunit UvrA [candidate division KSB1 bacterium]
MGERYIEIYGARTHNLKNIDLRLPRNRLIVITGVSGSGKSSLAFDTLYAEGQRRYVESLSSYARQFLERMDRPDVDEIRGISPAVAIEQKNPTRSSRSTVGTATEVHDYLRLLFARIGRTYCPECGIEVRKEQVRDVLEALKELPEGSKVLITFPMEVDGNAEEALVSLRQRGFVRLLRSDNSVISLDQARPEDLARAEVVVDRLVVRRGDEARWADSVSLAFREGSGVATLVVPGEGRLRFTQRFECSRCGRSFLEPEPRLFSFNNPFGACPTCKGFGDLIEVDLDLVVPDKTRSIRQGAIEPWNTPLYSYFWRELLRHGPRRGIDLDKPFAELSEPELSYVLHGDGDFPGVYGFFEWLETKRYKVGVRVFLSRYRGYVRCHACKGTRLRPEALYVKLNGATIADVSAMTISEARRFFDELQLSEFEEQVAGTILRELRNRLSYLEDVGLGYLTLDRRTATLSGGEFQRINLATALGSQLVGSLYVLDEPSIGLHPRDTHRLVNILLKLRDIGNTVLVVEHDRDTMEMADYIVDLGPGAGEAGGRVVFQGTYEDLRRDGRSLTGSYLRGNRQIPLPDVRRSPADKWLVLRGAAEHNLKNIDVEIPLGLFVVVTGVSGSGKSSLVHDVLYTALKRKLGSWKGRVGKHRELLGAEHLDDVVLVDQSPIGKTPRSNPATYVKAFDGIRQLFAQTRAARVRGFGPGHFSFNIPGGRCETCEGAGVVKVEMQFLADLYLQCETCGGKRYRSEVLEIRYHGRNIYEVLNMTVDEALAFFQGHPAITQRLQLLQDVGLGYLRLGQPATTLSGGEAQRVKLAAHLATRPGEHILYIFDEPTTGLHFEDIRKLLSCFDRLIQAGNSVLVIEHNLDVIKCADWVIDLGPEGGDAGGYVVACGPPEQIAGTSASYTGQYLRRILSSRAA